MPLLWAAREQTLTCPLGALVSLTRTLLSATVVTVLFWHESFPRLFVTSIGAQTSRWARTPEALAETRKQRELGRGYSRGCSPQRTFEGPQFAKPRVARKPIPACAPPSCPSAEAFPPLGSSLAAGLGLAGPPAGTPSGFRFLVKVGPWVEGGRKKEEFTIGA